MAPKPIRGTHSKGVEKVGKVDLDDGPIQDPEFDARTRAWDSPSIGSKDEDNGEDDGK